MSAPSSLTTHLLAFLRLLGGGQWLRLLGTFGTRAPLAYIDTAKILHTLPAQVLTGLERHDILRLEIAAYASQGAQGPATLNALLVRWRLKPCYRNPRKPESPHGKQWIFDTAAAETAIEKVHAFPLAPTAIIVGGDASPGGGYELAALWAIPSLDVRGEARHVQAMDLLRRLATRVGADVPDALNELTTISVAVPGSRIDQGIEMAPAQFFAFDPAVCTTVPRLEKELSR